MREGGQGLRVCLAGLTHITSWTSWPASASWTSWPASASCCSSSITSESSLWASTIGPIGTFWTQSSQSLCGWFNQIVIFQCDLRMFPKGLRYTRSYLIFVFFFYTYKSFGSQYFHQKNVCGVRDKCMCHVA